MVLRHSKSRDARGRRKEVKRKRKNKFQEYMENELNKQQRASAAVDADDIKLERNLASKLKVKRGMLGGGDDDGLNGFLEDISSVLGPDPDPDHTTINTTSQETKISKSRKRRKTSEEDKPTAVSNEENSNPKPKPCSGDEEEDPQLDKKTTKYMVPQLRKCDDSANSQYRRVIRGLLNKLSESNIESITRDANTKFLELPRSVGRQVIGEEVLASCIKGPRANDQYASIHAAFVTGITCSVGIDFIAEFVASLAKSFEEEYSKDDPLSLRNLALLLSYMYIFGVCSSDLIYNFLSLLSKRLEELDVSVILAILQCCGMKLRGDDPTAMKEFILNIQKRVNELKSLHETTEDGKPKISGKRMDFMLETICDIKNNKRRTKEDPSHHNRIKKWLQKLRAEDIMLRGLTWDRLLDPQKKGQWWLSGDIVSANIVEEGTSAINRETLEEQKLLQLAAAQRMNTLVRREIFCIIMSSEDYIDASEKILRWNLQGKQDREIIRVVVDCCLQEKTFNKYYTLLASKLCGYVKNHRFTLQYCLWDHFREIESMEPFQSYNLAWFVAEMVSSFTLSLSVLKTVDLMDPGQLTPKRVTHFILLFDAILEKTDAKVWNMFTRIAAYPELEPMRSGFIFFINQFVITSPDGERHIPKIKILKKALANVDGVLMDEPTR